MLIIGIKSLFSMYPGFMRNLENSKGNWEYWSQLSLSVTSK